MFQLLKYSVINIFNAIMIHIEIKPLGDYLKKKKKKKKKKHVSKYNKQKKESRK